MNNDTVKWILSRTMAATAAVLFTMGSPAVTQTADNDPPLNLKTDGFFSVGDLARCDAGGYYYLESRKHDMVISGGVNIYPAEIESVLHAVPGVHDCAVFGIPDAEFGEQSG